MTTTHAWPFLVARGNRKGYRTVLAPDFLARNRRHGLLAERVGSSAAEGRTAVEHISDDVCGNLTVSYRVEPALIDELTDGPTHPGHRTLLDQHGRPLELLYGLVTTSPVTMGGRDLGQARAEAVASYRRFLADEDTTDVQWSAAIPLRAPVPVAPRAAVAPQMVPASATGATVALPRTEPTGPVARPVVPPDPHHRSRGNAAQHRLLRVGLLAALTLVALTLAGKAVERGLNGAADDVTVTVHDASDREQTDRLPSCDDVHVEGVIATDGPVSVDYGWTVDGRPTAPLPYTFADAGRVTVDGPTAPRAGGSERTADGAAIRRYELVVIRHDGNGARVDDSVRVRCAVGAGTGTEVSPAAVRLQDAATSRHP